MADIDLIIKIDEEDYNIMKHNITVNNPLCPLRQEEMVSKIANGTPLPKGHGRLGDLDELEQRISNFVERDVNITDEYTVARQRFIVDGIRETPTIIEADKAESEGKE